MNNLVAINEELINEIYDDCNQRGFPHYQLSLQEKTKELDKLKKFDLDTVIVNGVIRQTMHALGFAWSYFPHFWDIKVKKMKTPMDVWTDELLLKKAIKKRLNRGGYSMLRNNKMSDSQIRKAIRTYSGVQSVSNFRPSAAAAIYKKYANNGTVWDMSCGFGGRLIGALASGCVKKYIGTDPSTLTMNGLLEIKKEFCKNLDVDLHKIGSENFIPNERVDLCFTSPPYFDTEKYANEETQSYLAYKSIDNWNENFLRKTIQNCYKSLKPNGYLIINIANVLTHKTLENDCVKIAIEERFKLKETLKLQLSSITKGGFKYEPVFVFTKEST